MVCIAGYCPHFSFKLQQMLSIIQKRIYQPFARAIQMDFCTKHNGRQLGSKVFICNKLDVSKHPRSTLQHVMLNAAQCIDLFNVQL